MRQGFYCKIGQFYYKMQQLLQNTTILIHNATAATKCVCTVNDKLSFALVNDKFLFGQSKWENLE